MIVIEFCRDDDGVNDGKDPCNDGDDHGDVGEQPILFGSTCFGIET